MNTVYILGAGVDRPLGLPLADGLLQELGSFAKSEGRDISQAIKGKLGGGRRVRFGFDKYVSNQGENFAERLLSDPGLETALEGVLAKVGGGTNGTAAVKTLIEKLKVIREANEVDEETARSLAALAGEPEEMADHTLLRMRGVVLNPAPRNAVLRILRDAQTTPGWSEEEKEALAGVVAALTNFEELLTELFAGFYTGRGTDIRSYLYVSWMLWAYIKWKSFTVAENGPVASFYNLLAGLPENDYVITFNYTSFGNLPPERTIRFHGDCLSYIRHDRGELITGDEAVTEAQDLDALKTFIETLDMNVDESRIFLPAIVPPSAMKPLINRDFIQRWMKAESLIGQADLLIVVGYSFNRVDSHFNDLFRSAAAGKRIAVINPDLDGSRDALCTLLGVDPNTLSAVTLEGVAVYRSERLLFVPVLSQDVSSAFLDRIRAGW